MQFPLPLVRALLPSFLSLLYLVDPHLLSGLGTLHLGLDPHQVKTLLSLHRCAFCVLSVPHTHSLAIQPPLLGAFWWISMTPANSPLHCSAIILLCSGFLSVVHYTRDFCPNLLSILGSPPILVWAPFSNSAVVHCFLTSRAIIWCVFLPMS